MPAPAKKIRSAAEIFQRISAMEAQITSKDFISLLYGSYGVGKTLLGLAIAQMLKGDGRILFLDSSDGFVSAEEFPGLMEDVDRYRVDDYRELAVLGEALKNRAPGFENYTVTQLDEVSSWFTDMLHAWVREAEGVTNDAPLPEIEGKHYGPPTHVFTETIGRFHKTEDMHLILVSHEQSRGREGSEIIGPALPPRFLREVNQKMHLVSRIEGVIKGGEYERKAQTQPSRRVVAKSRVSTLGAVEMVEDIPEKVYDWIFSGAQENDLAKPEEKNLDLPDDYMTDDSEAVEVE